MSTGEMPPGPRHNQRMRWFIRKHAGKLLILTFVGGFAVGEFMGLDQLLGCSRSGIENIETWIGATARVDSQQAMLGKVVGITDGDTLTLLANRTQHKIRLAEIDTPERGQDWGTRAR